MMEKPRKISEPRNLVAHLEALIADFENLEDYVSQQELERVKVRNKVIQAKDLFGDLLKAHGRNEITLNRSFIKEIQELIDQPL